MDAEERYNTMLQKLRDPDGWDRVGVFEDVRHDLCELGQWEAVAMLDWFIGRLDGKPKQLVG